MKTVKDSFFFQSLEKTQLGIVGGITTPARHCVRQTIMFIYTDCISILTDGCGGEMEEIKQVYSWHDLEKVVAIQM